MTRSSRSDSAAQTSRNSLQPNVTFTWSDALKQFTTHLEAGLKSKETVDTYTTSVKQAAAHIAGLGLPDDVTIVRGEHLELFLADLGKRVSPATALNRRKGLNAFFRWLLAEKEIRDNPLVNVPWPAQEDKAPRALTVTEVKSMLTACSRTFLGTRRAALIAFMVDTGWRSSAVRVVTVEMVQERGVIRVPAKGRKEAMARLTPTAQLYLDRYLRRRKKASGAERSDLWLTTSGKPMSRHDLWADIAGAGNSAGIEGVHPHTLRHTHALWWLEEGGNVMDLQENLGHSSLRVTQRYLRYLAQERALQARSKFGPANRLAD